MKILILTCFLLLSNIKYDNPEFDSYFFRNNFNDDINDEGRYFYSLFRIGNRFGDSSDIVFKNLDTQLYKNKNLGFVVNDLSNQFNFLECISFNGVLGYDQINLSHRTHFAFIFKYNDTLSLSIDGMLAKSERFYEVSDSVAFNRLIIIEKYILLPVIHDMKGIYRKIIKRMKTNNSPMLKEQLESLLKTYPEVAK